jgi:antitoxin (DNA-binding transcriptional repressor) of toxin-antitoxin stability system
MPDVSATSAARNFADLLDAIEHRNERFTIVRRGKAIAQLEPIARGRGAEVKAALRSFAPDPEWADEVVATRQLLTVDERS